MINREKSGESFNVEKDKADRADELIIAKVEKAEEALQKIELIAELKNITYLNAETNHVN